MSPETGFITTVKGRKERQEEQQQSFFPLGGIIYMDQMALLCPIS